VSPVFVWFCCGVARQATIKTPIKEEPAFFQVSLPGN